MRGGHGGPAGLRLHRSDERMRWRAATVRGRALWYSSAIGGAGGVSSEYRDPESRAKRYANAECSPLRVHRVVVRFRRVINFGPVLPQEWIQPSRCTLRPLCLREEAFALRSQRLI